MKITDVIQAVRGIGLANALRVAGYTRERQRIERRWPRPGPEGPWTGPGGLRAVVATESGLKGGFDAAEVSVSFFRDDLVELFWTPGGVGADEVALPWPPGERLQVAVEAAEGPEGWTAATAELAVTLGRDGSLRFYGPAPRGSAPASVHRRPLIRQEAPPNFREGEFTHRARLAPGERVHGLGEKAAPLDLRGGSYRIWNLGPGGSYGPGADPLYVCVPAYFCRATGPAGSRPADPAGPASSSGGPGYLVVYASTFPGRFDLGQSEPEIAEHHFAGGPLRYYLMPGPVDRALERFTALVGRPDLPALWTLGYHQCRWSYYPAERVQRLAADFTAHEIPVDAIHLDIHYMDGYRVFTVDRRRFPDLAGLSRELAEQGVHLVTILDPGVKVDPGYYLYREGVERGYFCTLPDGSLATAPVWPGTCAFPDFSRADAREWWGRQYQRLLDAGVAGFWHDMNEPSVFTAHGEATLPTVTRHQEGDHAALHNLYGVQNNQAGYEGLRRLAPDRRPFIISRSGWTGGQRFAWNWTGDVDSDWGAFRQTLRVLLNLGLSGQPFSGSDVGGFHGVPTPELYIRWLQMSAFVPFFRSHTVIYTPDQEPWSYGEPYTTIAREFIRLRYALLPLVYTLAWEAREKGWPLVRPLFWPARREVDVDTSPEDQAAFEAALEAGDAFLFGDDLLVAPVFEPDGRSRDVPVPAGRWYDYWTGRVLTGPALVRLEAPLERLPLLVRAGAVLFMEDPALSTTRRSLERLYLHVFPPEPESRPGPGPEAGVQLYTDVGEGYGPHRVDAFHLRRPAADRLELRWEPDERPDAYPWPYRETVIIVHGPDRIHQAVVGGRERCFDQGSVPITPGEEVALRLSGNTLP